ncbi:MAG: radical SAM protein [Desulfovibrio sp.]|nr:radical SAM protein [Desulfovibrio sp.]MBI4957953.1 radical SAM protein [Desulfovibrio sp.]
MDSFAIDGHKLMLHPDRVAAWVAAGDDWEALKKIYPLYVEISPIGACNHRCTFCALDYMGYAPKQLDAGLMVERLAEMGEKGVRSVMFAGEGEPLLNTRINEMVEAASSAGIDTSFTTNGVLLGDRFVERSLSKVSWIKVSCNAGSPETYKAIHRCPEGDFDKVRANLRRAVEARQANGWGVSIGVQILLLPENVHEVEDLARICRDEIGVDYLVVKPFSQHKRSHNRQYENIDYGPHLSLKERLDAMSTERFSVVFRATTMQNYSRAKAYSSCFSTPFFWAYVSSTGDLVSCSAFLGDERFKLGNIQEHSFAEVWEGARRRISLEMMHNLDITECRSNCRMDKINAYLWRLRNPAPHDNFI